MIINRYGLDFKEGTSQLEVELSCYCHNHTKEKGGLGKLEHFKNAYQIAYPEIAKSYFSWTELMFKAYAEESKIGGGVVSVLGGSGCSKSFSTGYWADLDFLAAPKDTITLMASTSLDELNERVWKYTKQAHEYLNMDAQYPLKRTKPQLISSGSGGILTKALDNDPEGESIKGFHPKRLRIIIDEGTAATPGVLNNYENWISSNKEFLLIVLSNFRGLGNLCSEVSKPIGGWNSIDYNTTNKWKTAYGTCLLLDLTKSPVYTNPELGKPGAPLSFLRSKESIDKAIQKLGAKHPRVFQYIRSIPAIDDGAKTVLTEKILEVGRVDRKVVWAGFTQEDLASLDPAFTTDGDECILVFGKLGWERSGKQILDYTEYLSLPIDSSSKTPTEYQILEMTVKECKKRGVPPENFITDSQGSGRGLGAIFRNEWSDKIKLIEPSLTPSEFIVDFALNKTGKELYDRFITELWFEMRSFIESGQITGLDADTKAQLCSRLYNDEKPKISLETKKKYKQRLYGDDSVNGSPDRADASVQLLYLAKDFGFRLSDIDPKYGNEIAEKSSHRQAIEDEVTRWINNRDSNDNFSKGSTNFTPDDYGEGDITDDFF